jgi:hypothetical protein
MELYTYDVLIVGAERLEWRPHWPSTTGDTAEYCIAERCKEDGGYCCSVHTQDSGWDTNVRFCTESSIPQSPGFFARKRSNVFTETSVIRIFPDRTALLSGTRGVFLVSFRKCILASGAGRKRFYPRILLQQPAGIMDCGTDQKLINVTD